MRTETQRSSVAPGQTAGKTFTPYYPNSALKGERFCSWGYKLYWRHRATLPAPPTMLGTKLCLVLMIFSISFSLRHSTSVKIHLLSVPRWKISWDPSCSSVTFKNGEDGKFYVLWRFFYHNLKKSSWNINIYSAPSWLSWDMGALLHLLTVLLIT